jgi:putative NADH-flavin reductase
MRVLMFGAGGHIGQAINEELTARGHAVTKASRSGDRDGAVRGDATSANDVAQLAAGHEAVISAIGPGPGDEPGELPAAAHALTEGMREAGVRRLLVVGGSGSLEVEPGVRLVDSQDFPAGYLPMALAHDDALGVYRNVDDIDWTFFSPPVMIGPGDTVGAFRLGGNQLLTDDNGASRISYGDFAIAIVDELENGNAKRQLVSVAY